VCWNFSCGLVGNLRLIPRLGPLLEFSPSTSYSVDRLLSSFNLPTKCPHMILYSKNASRVVSFLYISLSIRRPLAHSLDRTSVTATAVYLSCTAHMGIISLYSAAFTWLKISLIPVMRRLSPTYLSTYLDPSCFLAVSTA
jgi:hypothetical protein